MKNRRIVLLGLAFLLTAGIAPALAADSAPAAPAITAPEPLNFCALAPASTGSEKAGADLFVPKPLPMDPPTCNPFCIEGQCSKNSDCTAQPNGRCVLACPQRGCCVY